MEPKFKTEAHRKNYDLVMKSRSQRKLPLDSKKMLEQLRRNSKDRNIFENKDFYNNKTS